ncbi:NAD+ synthase [Cupriavidus sp. D39]|uniref:NAD+ synthase n=1 Tax=Cupriavidus sp. D39 TaxID=2997877 RepID=UPI00226E0FD8|nr:NAD+ synthase [Cupriavidus sp. D39]MCY0855555.1 NAD+ synthase [Cupriavidus sp. D39]
MPAPNAASLRIACAQLNYTLCDFDGNARRIVEAIGQARQGGADMVVFSELALSGYNPQDMLEEPGFLDRQASAIAAVIAATAGTDIVVLVGAVVSNPGIGKRFHNAVLAMRDGRIEGVYAKRLLPNYGIFQERRWFEPGPDAHLVVEVKGIRVGVLICEDAWNVDGRTYDVDPVDNVAKAGAELIVTINASPSNVGKAAQREALYAGLARRWELPFLYVNQVGGNDEIVFDGASFAVQADGAVAFRAPMFEEAIGVVAYKAGRFTAAGQAAQPAPTQSVADDCALMYRQATLALRDYAAKAGFSKVVVGSSGGIDSALTLALAVDALGAANVSAVTMPSRFSSAGSVDDSVTLCRNLGVALHTHPIGGLYAQYVDGFQHAFDAEPSRLARENVQARIRGAILMEYSNHFGALLLTTGNKSEASCGFFTIYGDACGGLNLIGDIYKTEVFALARYYNQRHGREIIPAVIIEKAPSAELSEGQKDTDSLPPYEILDEILKLAIEGERLRPAEYERARLALQALAASENTHWIADVHRLIARSEFKRRQAAPIVRMRPRAFGAGRLMPIAAKYG